MIRFCIYLLLSLNLSAFSQEINLPHSGSKTLYKPSQVRFAKVPAGYRAVYINYVGRHGARHLTKDVKLSLAWKLIDKADSRHMLSADGLELKKMIANLDKIEETRFASISISGAEELKGIAQRMFENERNIFDGATVPLLVSTTKKGRTKESAEAFLKGLQIEKNALVKDVKFNYADDDHLRFYDFSPAYHNFEEDGEWKKEYDQLASAVNLKAITARFSKRFFSTEFNLTNPEQQDFTEDIYGFYTILDAIKSEITQAGFSEADLNFKKYFDTSALKALAMLNDAEDFLKKGPGMHADGIQVRIAAPLLADFINTTDVYLKSGLVKADLRFAHAETIAPAAAIMNIQGASESVKDIVGFEKVWKADKIIPFSSNIQWILYKSRNGKPIVKFMLNEKEVSINGLPAKTFPYYDWASVRAFYLKKLKSLNVSLNEDMHTYLLNVK